MAEEKKEGEMPEKAEAEKVEAKKVEAPLTTEQLQAKLDELERHAKNKEAEAARVQRKLEQFEKAEADRKAAEMTEAEKTALRLKEQENELTMLKREKLVRKVADEVGLPAALAERLQGATEDELKADAEKLLALMPAKEDKPKLKTDPTNPGNAHREETEAEMRARLFPQSVNPFDPKMMRARGGGLVLNDKE